MNTLIQLLPILALFAIATAQSAIPTNSSVYAPASKLNTIYLWYAGGRFYEQISPLTAGALSILPQDPNAQTGLYPGFLYLTDTTRLDNFTARSMTYTSCDPGDYPGNLGIADVVNDAVNANVSAIVFYSKTANFCNITGNVGSYTRFYTMNSIGASQAIYNYLDIMSRAAGDYTQAQLVTRQAYENYVNATMNPYGSLPHGQTTAIAMIALYAVTGLITILFLIIIVTGAVRAHRHPDRYGPRNIIGRPRQSRAKGLARAMLETLPIVKFGEPIPPKQQHGDVELAETSSVEQATRTNPSGSDHGITAADALPSQDTPSKSSGAIEHDRPIAESVSDAEGDLKHDGAIPIAAEADSGDQMCSICTDEFELGEDIRLLPCNHMFHPACVDPWLLDISGTCPLCRIDLNPVQSNTETPADAADSPIAPGLAPPLDPASGRRARVYRALFGERPPTAASQRANPQETVEALRRYREANREGEGDSSQAQAEQQRRRRFFRRRNRAERAERSERPRSS